MTPLVARLHIGATVTLCRQPGIVAAAREIDARQLPVDLKRITKVAVQRADVIHLIPWTS